MFCATAECNERERRAGNLFAGILYPCPAPEDASGCAAIGDGARDLSTSVVTVTGQCVKQRNGPVGAHLEPRGWHFFRQRILVDCQWLASNQVRHISATR